MLPNHKAKFMLPVKTYGNLEPINMDDSIAELRLLNFKLEDVIRRQCSDKWCLRVWSRFIKFRDEHKCLNCNTTEQIQAHHIFRKTTYPKGYLATGNGITLCRNCHNEVHKHYNGRPNNSKPLDAQGGDDQDEIAYFYFKLYQNSKNRKLPQNEFYYFPNDMLGFFVSVQGYEWMYWEVQKGNFSSLEMAYRIWTPMPQIVYEELFAAIHSANL